MRSFIAFFKKEFLEISRTGKLIILGAIFLLFGIMNPAIAKLTPYMLEMFSEDLAGSGMVITEVTVDALTSWTQFFKNIPMALIAFVLLCGSIFTKEYESGTLLLVLTKGIARYKIVFAKTFAMISLWTAGYWLCFSVTYAYNDYFWDNSIVKGLIPAVIDQWIFGILIIALIVFFSAVSKTFGGVLLGTVGAVALSYVAAFFPKLASFAPTSLMNSAGLLIGAESFEDYSKTVVTAVVITVMLIASSIPIMNKKHL